MNFKWQLAAQQNLSLYLEWLYFVAEFNAKSIVSSNISVTKWSMKNLHVKTLSCSYSVNMKPERHFNGKMYPKYK